MEATCTNPPCKQQFRELSKGRLFLLPPVLEHFEIRSEPRLIDHCYWLCPECAPSYTIELEANRPIVRRLKRDARQDIDSRAPSTNSAATAEALGSAQRSRRIVSTGSHFDLRNSRRFPLQLQVTLKTATEEYRAKTIDISAGAILFHTEAAIQVNSLVQLTIEILGETLGAERPVLLKCQGQVVRCCEDAPGWDVGVVIDAYLLERL